VLRPKPLNALAQTRPTPTGAEWAECPLCCVSVNGSRKQPTQRLGERSHLRTALKARPGSNIALTVPADRASYRFTWDQVSQVPSWSR
jgi:hypothetical protein